jgi:hypothetical protein
MIKLSKQDFEKKIDEIVNNWFSRKLTKSDVLYSTTVDKLKEDLKQSLKDGDDLKMNDKKLKRIAKAEYKRDKEIFNLGYNKAHKEEKIFLENLIKVFKLELKEAEKKGYSKAKEELKDNGRQILNTFLMWLDWLKQSPKNTWEEQIKVKAQQIFKEINK